MNSVEDGQISGVAIVTWRKRNGSLPAVVFYDDDESHSSDVTCQVVVKSGGNVIKSVSGITGYSWTFTDETSLNSGDYFNALTFEISTQKPGVTDSTAITINVSR